MEVFIARSGHILLAILGACTSIPPSPELTAVAPSEVTEGRGVSLTLHGRNFHPFVRGNLASPERSTIDTRFRITLNASTPLGGARWLSERELSIELPATIPLGEHSLTVMDSWGRTSSLADALVVIPEVIIGSTECLEDEDCSNDPCSTSSTCDDTGFCVFDKDTDGDLHIDAACGGDDCDDDCDRCRPGLNEVCDGLDNDCDPTTPDGSGESDYGASCDGPDADSCEEGVVICDGTALVCDDFTGDTSEVVGDEIDQDCDGGEICFVDADGDGQRTSATIASTDFDCADVGEAALGATIDCDDDPGACGAACFVGNPSSDLCDGMDNDCDGSVDEDAQLMTWFLDDDTDGFTDSSTTQVACSDPDGAGVRWTSVQTPDDCDDSDPAVHHGSVCDDGEPCTAGDVCNDGECRGVATLSCPGCAASCDGGCGAAGCCIQTCSTNPCPTCESGCSCNIDCDASGDCTQTCEQGSTCSFTGAGNSGSTGITCQDSTCSLTCDANGLHCQADCQDGAVCDVDCLRNGGDCLVNCADTASCRINCDGNGGDCTANCLAPVTCGNGGIVCNRPCPCAGPGPSWYADTDGDGYGDPNVTSSSCNQPAGYVVDNTDCADSAGSDPACNGLDGAQCHPGNAGTDVCDGADNDCDGTVDEDSAALWYPDADGDGYGDGSAQPACTQVVGYVSDNTDCADTPGSDPDCNDLDGAACNPGRTGSDLPDGADNDCDGFIDEDAAWEATEPISPFRDDAQAIVLQPDGRMVVVGAAANGSDLDFAIARFHPDGSLDPSFGSAGVVTVDLGTSNDRAYDVALAPDGSIAVAGAVGDFPEEVGLLQLDAAGSLDGGFGAGGVVVASLSGSFDVGSAVAVRDDGSVLVGGTASGAFFVACYRGDGTLDPAFGNSGVATTDLTGSTDQVSALEVLSDGSIVAGGNAHQDFAVAKYTASGGLDSGFGVGGVGVVDIGPGNADAARDMAIAPDGKIVVAGWTLAASWSFGSARFLADGTIDSAYGSSGTTTDVVANSAAPAAVAIQDDGRVILAGLASSAAGSEIALMRYDVGGVLDATFGSGGVVQFQLSGMSSAAEDVVVDVDGSIIVVGRRGTSSSSDFAIVRLGSDG